ncbi:MAG: carboxypeptidase-like regulatory domain-containing protein [Candidatus Muirbacterium halophilum]|nr:carboxypeptidase-like regulatory domain-containing protein [Candidatus Muirbacterium halophilum]MCK9474997.1 carboxypeptidase-like regulatory domain-containing protein [Candidatus Muirbacterium halophilum]
MLGNFGTAEIQFIYIENYNDDTNEIEYKGKIEYVYENQNINNSYSWILIDTVVSFCEIETGLVIAIVKFFGEPIENINVYGKSSEEYTEIGTTDQNGMCIIDEILVNMYDIVFVSENFPEKIISNVNVTANEVSTVEVNLLPFETNENASVFGYVYFDIYKTEPAADVLVTVYCENTDTIYKPFVTDSNGYFIINSLPEGTYEISAVIEKNEKNTICHINAENFGSAVKVDDIIMYNNSPVVTLVSHNPSEEINIEYNGKLKFIVEAYDSDNNQIWSCKVD